MMEAVWTSLLGVIIGAGMGYFTTLKGVEKASDLAIRREKEACKVIILNELKYSTEIFEKSYKMNFDGQENISLNIIKRGTLIIDKNCIDSIKCLDLTTFEKKSIIEWITCLEESEGIMITNSVRSIAGCSLWKKHGIKIGEDMLKLLPSIMEIIIKLEHG